MANDDIELLTARLVDGIISEDDFARLKAWTATDESHRDMVRRQMEAIVSANAVANGEPFDVQAAIDRFEAHAGAAADDDNAGDGQARTSSVRHIRLWLRCVAAAAVVVGVLWGVYHLGGSAVKDDFADIVTEVPAGGSISLTLPDGTKVALNSSSTFSYSQGFGISDRTVKLRGEGYFTITHRDDLPFVVETGEMAVTDLGTEFLFRNYETDSSAVVALYAGSAKVDSRLRQGETIMLRPGEQVAMNKLTGEMTKTKAEGDGTTARQMSDLTFSNATLAYIAGALSRAYGVNVTVADSVAAKTFYCSFNRRTDSLQDILDDLAKTRNIHYRKSATGYELY